MESRKEKSLLLFTDPHFFPEWYIQKKSHRSRTKDFHLRHIALL